QFARRAMDRTVVTAVGAGLLAADIILGGPVEMAGIERVARRGGDGFGHRLRFQRFLPAGLEIGGHALAATLAPETALLIAAEADGGVELVGAVDPDHAGLEPGRDIEGEIDVLAPQ